MTGTQWCSSRILSDMVSKVNPFRPALGNFNENAKDFYGEL
jgi:hypothetical protein